MSDNYLRVFPTDMHFIPPEGAAHAAVAILVPVLPEADRIVAETYGYPAFIDQGSNLEVIICPACRSRLPFHPAHEAERVRTWWYGVVDPLEGRGVADLSVPMLCCGASVPFPTIAFEWPAGVASFELSVLNPGIGEPLDPGLVRRLEATLGCTLRQVLAHY